MVVIYGVYHLQKYRTYLSINLVIVPAIAWILVLLSGAGAHSLGAAIQALATITPVCLIFFIFSAQDSTPDLGPQLQGYTAPHVLTLVAPIASVHALWALGQVLLQAPYLSRGAGGFFNRNHLAAFLAPTIIYLVFSILNLDKRTGKDDHRFASSTLFLGGLLTLLVSALLATHSRSGLLAIIIALPLLLIGFKRFYTLFIFGLIAAGGGVWLVNIRGIDLYSFSRWEIWKNSIHVALQHPFGVGLGGFTDALRVQGVWLDSIVHYPKVATQAHNELLHAWVEMGLPGLIAIVIPVLFIIYHIIFIIKNISKQQGLFHLAVLITFAIPALTSRSLHILPIIFFAAAWAGSVVHLSNSAIDRTVIRTLKTDRNSTVNIFNIINIINIVNTLRTVTIKRLASFLLALTLLATMPSLAAFYMGEYALIYRSKGNTQSALRWAEYAGKTTPWRLSPQLLSASLKFQNSENPAAVLDMLYALHQQFPTSDKPLTRAIYVIDHLIKNALPQKKQALLDLRLNTLATLVIQDPHNVLHQLSLARAQYANGKIKAAFVTLNNALDKEPNFANGWATQVLWMTQNKTLTEQEIQRKRITAVNNAYQAHRLSKTYSAYNTQARRILELGSTYEKMLAQWR